MPHSLRLQGILVGGVVVVYNKQQAYLLEDVRDMVVRAGLGDGVAGCSMMGCCAARSSILRVPSVRLSVLPVRPPVNQGKGALKQAVR